MTDYDKTDIPASYDRAREHGPEVRELWMRTTAAHVTSPVSRILDLGCGTGRFSEALAAHFRCEVVGLDPSTKMLEQARAKQRDERVQYLEGHAETMPLAADSVDLIFMSMSFHHFTDPIGAARECRRVVRSRGSVILRTGTRDQAAFYPYVPYFAPSRARIEQRLPSRDDIHATFLTAGFREVTWQIIPQTIAPNWSLYADKIAAGGDSVLATLSAEEFAQGLAELRRVAVTDGERPVIEPIDFFVFRPHA